MVFVIGNGESRKGFDLTKLKGKTIGCNALYRDFVPDILVANDRSMIDEIKGASPKCEFYWRKRTDHPKKFNLMKGADIAFRDLDLWADAGILALFVAVEVLKAKEIYMLGFEFLESKHINNVYKDTKNYQASGSESSDRDRIDRLNAFVSSHQDVKFINVTDGNLQTMTYSELGEI